MPPRRSRNNARRGPPPQTSQTPSTSSRIRTETSVDPERLAYPDNEMSQTRLLGLREHQLEQTDYQIRALSRMSLTRLSEPKLGDRDITQVVQSTSRILLGKLEPLLAERMRIAPLCSKAIEDAIVALRIRLDVMYWRIFRINDLPPEILANIFRFIAWSATKASNRVKARLWLTWVCRHWRSVAISDSTIWNVIWIWNRPPFEQASIWLDRAGAAPLDMRISESGNDEAGKFTGAGMTMLLDKIFVKLSQIRMFVVVLEDWPPVLVLLDKLSQFGREGMTMNLERFELHRSGNTYVQLGPGYQPGAHRLPIKLFGQASHPHLTYLCLNGVHIDWTNSQLSNLTALDLRRMPLEVSPNLTRFRHMLQCSPNLFKLSLDGAGPSDQPTLDLGLDPVPLPRLRILVLGDFSLHYGLYVFSQIDTSGVRDLTLMNMTGEDYTPFVAAIISRFTQVQILTIYTFEVDDSPSNRKVFVKWLDSMPDLSYLKIAQVKPHILETISNGRLGEVGGNTSSGNPSISAMNIHPIVCPKLTAIEYENMDNRVIIRFVANRMLLGAPIRKVYVNERWTSSVSTEEQEAFRRLTNLFITPAGGTSPDEDAIIRAFSNQ